MESTGKYWHPVFNILEPAMAEVRIANPKWVKQVRGEKDGQKDATMICNKYRHGETKASYIPDRKIRDARSLTRLRTKLTQLTQQRTTCSNRITNMLLSSNYRLDMVFSTIGTKSAQNVIRLLISGEPFTDKELFDCVSSRCRAAKEEIREAVNGIPFTDAQREQMKLLIRNYEELEDQLRELQRAIDKHLKDYEEIIRTLCTVPGISRKDAQSLLAEIGPDMDCFASPGRLTRWDGLAQDCNESADSKYSNRVGQGGKYLKPLTVQIAWAAVRSKIPYYRVKFNNIASRRGKKRAIVAVARKILVSIWAMLRYGADWKPLDMDEKSGCPRELVIRKSINKAIEGLLELTSLGALKEDQGEELIKSIQCLSTP